MRFSIIVPTYNRSEVLAKMLASIEVQTFAKDDFEVLVIDDGSSDETKKIAEEFIGRKVLNLKYFLQNHGGPGRARNLGIERSAGEILLFCGDDTIFSANLLEKHNETYLKEGGQRNIGVLGMFEWDESRPVNEFMRYIAPAGPQFHFNTIKNVSDAGWDHFYTCNISIYREAIGNIRFDNSFIYAAFEDLDLGLILDKKGVKILFNKDALAFHCHFYAPESFYNRMFLVGRSFIYFYDKHKAKWLDGWRLKIKYAPFDIFPGQLFLFYLISKLLSESTLLKRINIRYHWYSNVCRHYAAGIIAQRLENKSKKL